MQEPTIFLRNTKFYTSTSMVLEKTFNKQCTHRDQRKSQKSPRSGKINKIEKEGQIPPFRPNISSLGTFNYQLAKWLSDLLVPSFSFQMEKHEVFPNNERKLYLFNGCCVILDFHIRCFYRCSVICKGCICQESAIQLSS